MIGRLAYWTARGLDPAHGSEVVSLPPELRIMIYEAAYVENATIEVIGLKDWRRDETQRRRNARRLDIPYKVSPTIPCVARAMGTDHTQALQSTTSLHEPVSRQQAVADRVTWRILGRGHAADRGPASAVSFPLFTARRLLDPQAHGPY